MTKTFGINTSAALSGARRNGLVVRDFVSVQAKDRNTGDMDWLCVWNGKVPVTASIIKPSDGSTITRDFQAMGSLLQIQAIPGSMGLEVRTIRVKLSKLPDAVLNIFRTYDARMAPIQIHRGLFDPDTRQLVDPAQCRFDGFINNAPIRTPKAGGEGAIEAECVSFARMMTRKSGKLFSDETLKLRSGDRFGKYLDEAGAWRVWWGQEEKVVGNGKTPIKEKFLK